MEAMVCQLFFDATSQTVGSHEVQRAEYVAPASVRCRLVLVRPAKDESEVVGDIHSCLY